MIFRLLLAYSLARGAVHAVLPPSDDYIVAALDQEARRYGMRVRKITEAEFVAALS